MQPPRPPLSNRLAQRLQALWAAFDPRLQRWRSLWHPPQALLAVVLTCLAVLAGAPARSEAPAQQSADVLRLDAHTRDAAAWPVTRILEDTGGGLDARAAWHSLGLFEVPRTPYQNLGQRASAVWLHIPVAIGAHAPGNWVARLEYPLLNEVDFVVFDRQGLVVHQSRTGSLTPFSQRPLQTRALSADLHLQPGQSYDVMVRIRTMTAVIVPLHFMPWSSVNELESRDQILFGILGGLMLFMLAYSLSRWISLRQPAFLAYAGVLSANGAFALALYGVGAQYLWPDSAWLATQVSAGSSLAVVAANLYFCLYALEVRQSWPRLATAVQIAAAVVLTLLAAFLLGVISYRQGALAASIGVVCHVALFLPVVVMRWRRDDRAAPFMVAGWLSFAAGMLVITTLLRGLLPVNGWTLYGAQFGATGEMLCWLMVLGLRVEHLREAAERSRREHDLLDALAHTDPLTGLANRRGLERVLAAGIGDGPRADGRAPLKALFLLDLDGFKQINDQLGHEAGDAVLTTLAQRLKGATRAGDLVARIGGDEFVVLATGLNTPADAAAVGCKLLAQFEQPLLLAGGQLRRIGGTVGYSLASGPVRDANAWMREADAAMYAGKSAGKLRLVAYAELASHQHADSLHRA
jgi:diguanylate cyclase (GGDEF)-like protein